MARRGPRRRLSASIVESPYRTERRITQEVSRMRKIFELGGVIAAAVLIALGIVTLVMGFNGHNTVGKSLTQEYIVGTPDMTPAGIKAEAAQAKLPPSIVFPTCNVAGKPIN